jgi:MFS family permease
LDLRLLVLALGMFALGTDSFVTAGLLPELSSSLHVSAASAGQLVPAYALTYAVLSPIYGRAHQVAWYFVNSLSVRWAHDRPLMNAPIGYYPDRISSYSSGSFARSTKPPAD